VVIVMTLCLVLLSAVLPIAATVSPYIVVALRCCIGLCAVNMKNSYTYIFPLVLHTVFYNFLHF
jgi:hypothetical protein